MLKKQSLVGFKKFRYNSVFVRNFLVMTVFVILLVCLLISVFFYQIRKNIADEIYDMNYMELERTAETLDTIVSQIENFAYYMTIENDTKLLIMETYEENFDKRAEVMKEKISSFQKTFDYISEVAVYVEKYDALIDNVSNGELEDKEKWITLYEKVEDQVYLLGVRISESGYPAILTFLHPIRNERKEIEGAVVVEVDLNKLNHSLGRGSKDVQKLYMINDEGIILYSNDIKEIKYPERRPEVIKRYCEYVGEDRDRLVESERMELFVVPSNIKGVTYVMNTPNIPNQKMSDTLYWLILVSIGAIFASIMLSYILARHSYRPIQDILDETIDEEQQDAFVVGENVKNEIQFITECIRGAKRKNAQLTVEVSDWMKQLGDAQMMALQSQINPHFIYNTLDAINWLILAKTKGKVTPASDAISALAKLLRISMNRSSYLVTLKEELDHAMLYMKLMNIRYTGRIQVFWEIPEELQNQKVIRLCLQPILENAISHGFGKNRGRGTIHVLGDIVFDTLIIRVVDDGVGLSEEACRKMNQELIANYEMRDKHVGIRNVNRRIRILFGEKYGVQVTPGETSGLVVVLGFPANGPSESI